MKKKSRIIMLILVLVWAAVIFCFSAQDGERSSETSGRIVVQVIRLIEPDYDMLPRERQLSLTETLTFFIRKGAHFTEYMILGGLLWGLYLTFTCRQWRLIWLTWLTGTAYAATDELHQMFSDGRSPQLTDVGIDSSGVLCGAVLCLAAYAVITFIIQRKRQEESR